MRYPYTATIECEKTGVFLGQHDCEVDVEDNLTVSAVYIDGHNIYFGDDLASRTAHRIAEQAEDEIKARGWLYDRVIDDLSENFDPAATAAEHRMDLHREGAV